MPAKMRIIHTDSINLAVRDIAERIIAVLQAGKPVLWLVCGGSNISAAVAVMKSIRTSVSAIDISRLTVGLTDERFGPVGHVDSNWKQLEDAGFEFTNIGTLPTLKGEPLEETVHSYSKEIDEAINTTKSDKGLVVAILGIGADGHIAGILPDSSASRAQGLTDGYEAGPYMRVTLTFTALRRLDEVYALVFGARSKHTQITRLVAESVALSDQPCQILKEITVSSLYTDLLVE